MFYFVLNICYMIVCFELNAEQEDQEFLWVFPLQKFGIAGVVTCNPKGMVWISLEVLCGCIYSYGLWFTSFPFIYVFFQVGPSKLRAQRGLYFIRFELACNFSASFLQEVSVSTYGPLDRG